LKRKYDDSEDVSEYDDLEDDSEDDSDDDDPPPPPKKRKHARSSKDSTVRIKKRIKTYLLQLERMLPFEDELLTHGAFGPKQWKQLYDQLGDDDEYVVSCSFQNRIRSGEQTSSALLEILWHPTALVTFHT
jgi:hypothetical protein